MIKLNYSFWIGAGKALKNMAVLGLPLLIALSPSIPLKYAPIFSFVVYMIKNAVEFKYSKK